MSVHTHHANVKCPDCGEKHSPGAMLDCVDVLKDALAQMKADLFERDEDAHEAERVSEDMREAIGQLVTACAEDSGDMDSELTWQEACDYVYKRINQMRAKP